MLDKIKPKVGVGLNRLASIHFDIPIINGLQGDTKPISYTESQTSAETRTLEIDFPQNRSFVEIKGTQIVPEFPFAIPILLVSIASLIVFYRTRIRK